MPENLHLVFSKRPDSISDQEYNDWYDAHLAEILVVPGFVAARRYRLESSPGATKAPAYCDYLSAYEIEGSPTEVMEELDKEVESGRMKLPDWFPEIRFTSFNCHSHGNATEPALVDHLYFVFSAPPEGIDAQDYVDWYKLHAAENTKVPGFLTSWRFRLEPVVVDPAAPATSTHLALYQVNGDLPTLRAALDEARPAREKNVIDFPAWFGQIPFVWCHGLALGERVPAPARR